MFIVTILKVIFSAATWPFRALAKKFSSQENKKDVKSNIFITTPDKDIEIRKYEIFAEKERLEREQTEKERIERIKKEQFNEIEKIIDIKVNAAKESMKVDSVDMTKADYEEILELMLIYNERIWKFAKKAVDEHDTEPIEKYLDDLKKLKPLIVKLEMKLNNG